MHAVHAFGRSLLSQKTHSPMQLPRSVWFWTAVALAVLGLALGVCALFTTQWYEFWLDLGHSGMFWTCNADDSCYAYTALQTDACYAPALCMNTDATPIAVTEGRRVDMTLKEGCSIWRYACPSHHKPHVGQPRAPTHGWPSGTKKNFL